MIRFEPHDVQGLVVSGYGRMHESRYLLLAVDRAPAARRWLGELAERITASDGPEELRCVNVACTSEGLKSLGLGAAELMTFSTPFREGMTAPYRQRILGDVGASDPAEWSWGRPVAAHVAKPVEQVHILLLLFARDGSAMATLEQEETERLRTDGGLRVIRTLTPEPLPGRVSVGKFGVEHFGFVDGISQPVLKHSGLEAHLAGDEARRMVIETGEFVLGYPNGYGELTPWPRLVGSAGADFGRNGTYLVMRHLAQDVAGFWTFLDESTKGPNGEQDHDGMERLAAKLVGRWRSGAPLVLAPHRNDPDLATSNAFGYADIDDSGERCPIGAHIRRSNPRDALDADPFKALTRANLHRIMRRGRVYGPPLDPLSPDDGQERGLFFICVNANIERQFEFLQHQWSNNPKFAGLYDERDPLIGAQEDDGGSFTIQQSPIRKQVHRLPRFVTVRGGAYFFLPGIRALKLLATRT
jgi:Dyp-type peroxidase family